MIRESKSSAVSTAHAPDELLMAGNVRLKWGGNLQAQQEADAAFARLKNKRLSKSANRKKKRASKKLRSKFGANRKANWIRLDGTVDYYKYIGSREWRKRRKEYFSRHERRCACGETGEIHLHHKTYARLGRERDDDLEPKCKGCHENEHEGKVDGVMDPMTREFLAIMG